MIKYGYLYFIGLAGMNWIKEGYIGVSYDMLRRFKQHERDAYHKHSIYTLHHNMRLHKDKLLHQKLFYGPIEECYALEKEYREHWKKGWNMAIGGGQIGSGWKPGENWITNALYNPKRPGETIYVNANNTLTDVARNYFPYHEQEAAPTGLSSLLNGYERQYKGWEISDGEIQKRIETRNARKWDYAYITDGKEIIKVHKSGQNACYEHTGLSKGHGHITIIAVGKRPQKSGWELATEDEWLETKERIEFK